MPLPMPFLLFAAQLAAPVPWCWNTDILVADSSYIMNAPQLYLLDDSELVGVFPMDRYVSDAVHRELKYAWCSSRDGGLSWSERREIPAGFTTLGPAKMPVRGMRLRDGSLLATATYGWENFTEADRASLSARGYYLFDHKDGNAEGVVSVIRRVLMSRSTDGGKTWKVSDVPLGVHAAPGHLRQRDRAARRDLHSARLGPLRDPQGAQIRVEPGPAERGRRPPLGCGHGGQSPAVRLQRNFRSRGGQRRSGGCDSHLGAEGNLDRLFDRPGQDVVPAARFGHARLHAVDRARRRRATGGGLHAPAKQSSSPLPESSRAQAATMAAPGISRARRCFATWARGGWTGTRRPSRSPMARCSRCTSSRFPPRSAPAARSRALRRALRSAGRGSRPRIGARWSSRSPVPGRGNRMTGREHHAAVECSQRCCR